MTLIRKAVTDFAAVQIHIIHPHKAINQEVYVLEYFAFPQNIIKPFYASLPKQRQQDFKISGGHRHNNANSFFKAINVRIQKFIFAQSAISN